MQATSPGRSARLDWLDYLRFISALFLMAEHYMVVGGDPRIGHGIKSYGLAADIVAHAPFALFAFFLMSGMLITMIAQSQPSARFVAHRLARLYPTFLICMTATALLAQFGPERLHVSWPQYFANLPIDAPAFGYRYVDSVYWSLVIEVIFYAAVLVAIMTRAVRRIQVVVTVWIALQVLCAPLPWRLPMLGQEYCFIAAGAVFALLYQRRNERLNFALLAVSWLLCLHYTMIFARLYHLNMAIDIVLVTAVFALFLIMRGRDLRLPFSQRIGSMTYPLYLLHFKIGLVVLSLTLTETNKGWVVAGLMLAMIAIGFVVDDVLEFRLRPLWIRIMKATVARPFARWDEQPRPTAATSSV